MARITASVLGAAAERVNGKLKDGLRVRLTESGWEGRKEVSLYDNNGFCNTLHIYKTNASALDFLSGMIDALVIVGR